MRKAPTAESGTALRHGAWLLFFVDYGLLVFAKSRSAECLEGCTPTFMIQRAVEQGKGCAGEETGEMGTEAHGRRKRRDGHGAWY